MLGPHFEIGVHGSEREKIFCRAFGRNHNKVQQYSRNLSYQKCGLYIVILTFFSNPDVVQWQRLCNVFGKQYFRNCASGPNIVRNVPNSRTLINREKYNRKGWGSPAETSNNPFNEKIQILQNVISGNLMPKCQMRRKHTLMKKSRLARFLMLFLA